MSSGTVMHKMKTTSKVYTFTRSLMALFGTDRRNETLVNHPDVYYKHVYFPKQLYDGIMIVAEIEHTSKKQAAELLMKAGPSSYMGGKLTEYIKNDQSAKELNQKIKMTRFVMVLRRYAREHGMDISKYVVNQRNGTLFKPNTLV
jgi:hypothetical protein